MLKHVQISPLRTRSDSLSCRSRLSNASENSQSDDNNFDEKPENPGRHFSVSSRAESCASLLIDNLNQPRATLRIHTACLKQDLAYRTLSVSLDCTSKDIITRLLRRCRMRHRDPRLFYLTMELTAKKSGARSVLELDHDAKPAALQACHPVGYSRFSLQVRRGGLVRVHDAVLSPSSKYKSLLLSDRTTVDELLALLLNCHDSSEPVERFSLYEVCPSKEYQRKLHPDDLPLRTQAQWSRKPDEDRYFMVSRNPELLRSRSLDIDDIETKPQISRNQTEIEERIFHEADKRERTQEKVVEDPRAPSNSGDVPVDGIGELLSRDVLTRSQSIANPTSKIKTDPVTRSEACLTRRKFYGGNKPSSLENNNDSETRNNNLVSGRFRKCGSCSGTGDGFAICDHEMPRQRYEPVYRLRTISNAHEDLFDRLRSIKLSSERKILLDTPSGPQSLTKGTSDSCFYV